MAEEGSRVQVVVSKPSRTRACVCESVRPGSRCMDTERMEDMRERERERERGREREGEIHVA